MLKSFTPRLYQETILATCASANTIVVLPTGLGKTAIAVLLAIHRLNSYPSSKVLFLAPTRPLVLQHHSTFTELTSFAQEDYAVFTGHVRPDIRGEQWKSAKIIFSTPQGLENDIINKIISLSDVSLIIFDEAHRASGDYSYVFIAKKYVEQASYARILALTASPGGTTEEILDVMKSLYIEKVEVRTEEDPDVKGYMQEVHTEWMSVPLPSRFLQIIQYLRTAFNSKLEELRRDNIIRTTQLSKTQILALQRELSSRIAQGEKDFSLMRGLSLTAEAMKLSHAIELAESQGTYALNEYLDKLTQQAATTKVKAVQNLVKDQSFRSAKILAEQLQTEGIEHPKLAILISIVKKELTEEKRKIIIFNQYRDQAETISKALTKEGITSTVFVGQQKKKNYGLSQKEQKKILDSFARGEFSCLIATSVAEEGLDIPKIDAVIFYEPIPSAIRTVQRRGRTGRLEKGTVYVLIAKGTRDEAYRWSSAYKERAMYSALKNIRAAPPLPSAAQQTLPAYSGIKIYTDYREKGSPLLKELLNQGVDVSLKKLDVGDYLISERICIEIKRIPDFVDSIIDGRLLSQLRDLRQYEKPLLILQGEEDIYAQRKIHQNAILGMMTTIGIAFSIPLIQTKTVKETSNLIALIAKQEQTLSSSYHMHSAKPLTLKEQQEFIVASLPGIGPALAKPLLAEFRSVSRLFNATTDDLKQVPLIGPVKAKKIKEVIDSPYGDAKIT
jgi:Fanconi anemia group M protein